MNCQPVDDPLRIALHNEVHARPSGFLRILLLAPESTSDTRSGRFSQRLLELETYCLTALRGLPVAKAMGTPLGQAERELANITAGLQNKAAQDQTMLDRLIGLAAPVDLITAEHAFRFAATAAYDKLVRERIAELRESPMSGTQTIGKFMQRRLSPAMATLAAKAKRLSDLSERISRTSALLRTHVDIATEEQNSPPKWPQALWCPGCCGWYGAPRNASTTNCAARAEPAGFCPLPEARVAASLLVRFPPMQTNKLHSAFSGIFR